jgi:predicted alpha/beta-hydrolase family hydrolase
VSHLRQLEVPLLIVQGTRDNFGGPDDLRAAIADAPSADRITIHGVEGGDHSLVVRRKGVQDQIEADVWDTVVAWIVERRR